MAAARARVIISGFVQGVFFRAYAREQAESLGLTGWVKNRWDGKVESVVEGEKSAVDLMISWFHKGPPHARVDGVEVTWEDPSEKYGSFSVTH